MIGATIHFLNIRPLKTFSLFLGTTPVVHSASSFQHSTAVLFFSQTEESPTVVETATRLFQKKKKKRTLYDVI